MLRNHSEYILLHYNYYQEFIIYSRERECLTAHIPCTNALRQVTPVNYRILTDLINASS